MFVDTAPVMEKPLAEAAGLGWQGKHTNLVSQEYGAWLFLGVILGNVESMIEKSSIFHSNPHSRLFCCREIVDF